MACGDTKVFFGGELAGLGDGALEEGFGVGGAMEVDEGVGTVVEEGRILRIGCGELRVERFCLVVLLIAGVETGEQAGEVGILGVGGTEPLDDGDGLCDFILRGVDGGELGVEGDVVGMLGEGCCQKRFGCVGFVLAEQEVDEGSGGGGISGAGGEDAAVGGLGGGEVVGVFGEFGGEEDVVGGLGGELEGLQELGAGVGWVGFLVEPGEGAVGAGFEGGIG
jgi:hypothetical protein